MAVPLGASICDLSPPVEVFGTGPTAQVVCCPTVDARRLMAVPARWS